jgi:hypothetical protein
MALGAPALEDAAGRGAAALLRLLAYTLCMLFVRSLRPVVLGAILTSLFLPQEVRAQQSSASVTSNVTLEAEAIARLRTKLDVVPVSGSGDQLAGRFTSTPKELAEYVGGFLSGEDLYLFPDGTYIYCEWADVQPLTVYDKGKWTVSGAVLELLSDSDVTWDLKRERRYILVRRPARPDEVFAIGLTKSLPYFEENVADDPEFMLLLVGKLRADKISKAKTAKLKAELMTEAWKPESFRDSPRKTTQQDRDR